MRDDFDKLKEIMAPPWDDVRERRVLVRIESEIDVRRGNEGGVSVPGGRRWARWVGSAAGIAFLCGGLVWWWMSGHRDEGRVGPRDVSQRSRFPQARQGGSGKGGSQLAFEDGSRAFLASDARVVILTQNQREVRLRQQAGTVRYRVLHRPGRRFVVNAQGLLIRDAGTDFTVQVLRSGGVHVAVRKGAVEVFVGPTWNRLEPGMELTVPRGDTEGAMATDAGTAPDAGIPQDPGNVGMRADIGSPSSGRSARGAGRLDSLFDRVDRARRAGRPRQAVALLRWIISSYSRDPRVTVALFTLGRVEAARGRNAAAARAFRASRRRSPNGPLAEDALAAEARAWALSGRADRARRAAAAYLARYPGGAHAAVMRRLVGTVPDAGRASAKGPGRPKNPGVDGRSRRKGRPAEF